MRNSLVLAWKSARWFCIRFVRPGIIGRCVCLSEEIEELDLNVKKVRKASTLRAFVFESKRTCRLSAAGSGVYCNGLFVGVDKCHDFVGAAIGAEDVLDLVLNELFDVGTAISDVLARIEMLRMSHEMLADTSRHSEAEIRVDVDLADCGLRSAAELILRDTDSVIEFAAVRVDDLHVLRNDGGSTVEDDRELRNLLLDFREDVEAELWRYENAVRVARALLRLELECAVARAATFTSSSMPASLPSSASTTTPCSCA